MSSVVRLETENPQPEFKQSRETILIHRLMVDRAEDRLVTLRELSDVTGKPISAIRGAVHTVIKRLRRDSGQVWESDRGIGYRRVSDAEMPVVLQKARERGYHSDRRALEKADCADPMKMANNERQKYLLNRTVLEMRAAAARPRSLNNLSQVVARSHNELPDAEQMVASIREALTRKMK